LDGWEIFGFLLLNPEKQDNKSNLNLCIFGKWFLYDRYPVFQCGITYSGGACSGNIRVEFGNSTVEFPQWNT